MVIAGCGPASGPTATPSGGVPAASALLEATALRRGLRVSRLDSELVLCDDGRRRALFHGLTGNRSSKVAHALCAHDGWLRARLARQGLPVVESRLAGADDAEFARRAAGSLGFPVRLRAAGEPGGSAHRIASDAAAFYPAWREITGPAPGRRTQVVIDVVPEGPTVEMAVVGGAVVPHPPPAERPAGDLAGLAVRALAAVPALAYGVVHVILTGAGPVVDRVRPSPGADAPVARAFAEAVLTLEMSDG
jgi:hypothetical protein